MAKCHLIIDSCCDLPASVVRRPGVTLMKFPYTVDGGTFEDDLFESVSAEAFYGAMRKGAEPSTAQVTLQTLTDTFTAAAEEGTPAVYLAFSSGLSASFDAACVVRDQVLAEHPDFELHIVDTHLASVAEGLLVYEALVQHEKGMSAAELAAWAEEARCFVNEEFMVDDLEALRRGGRISGAAALVGGMLSIKPVVGVVDGDVVVLGKARGSKQSKNMVFQKIDEAGGIDFTRPIWVAYSGLSDATARKYIADSLAQAKAAEEAAADESAVPDDLPLTQVGAVIGTHVGPGGVAFAFFARE